MQPAPSPASPDPAATFDVIVVGGYCLDLIFTGLPRFPELGIEVIGSGFDMAPGGAFNSAAAMHRLGLRVGWVADFGSDDFSRFVLGKALAEGLSDRLFACHDWPIRSVTVALSYPHERSFVAYYDPEPDPSAALLGLASAAARAIYLAHVHFGPVFEPVLARARSGHMQLIMDGNSSNHSLRIEQSPVRQALTSLDLFLANSVEARRMTGRSDLHAAMLALAELCPIAIVKNGADGAYACSGGQIMHQPAIAVTPVDTTGAGDCFSAGFVKAWLEDLPLDQCLRWGNIVGGLSTLAPGGAGRVVTSPEVSAWLKRGAPDE